LELAVCATYGLPHSQFLNWSRDDRDKALWYQIRQGETCRGCGTHPDEWDENKGGHRRAYLAEILVCPGCEVRQREEHELQNGERWKKVRGAYVVMRRNLKVRMRRTDKVRPGN
jgi:hypothetical protein